MAQLEILQCSGCGSPLPPGSLVCEYCGNKNLIQSKSNPLKITHNIAQKYIAFYAQKAKDNPKDTNALYSMGLLYLNLKNYELAQRNFKDAIDQSPMDADMYYFYALSLVAGKMINTMPGKEVERAITYLNTAIGMQTKCKYLVLLACIKEEYYVLNHLTIPGDHPSEIIESAQDYSPNELDEISENCNFQSEQSQDYIDNLLTGAPIGQGDDDDDDDYDEDLVNMDEDTRRLWYDYRFEPEKPFYNSDNPEYDNSYRVKESYVVCVISRLWKFFLALLCVLFFILCSTCSDSIVDGEVQIESPSVESLIAIKEEARGKRFTRNERQEEYTKLAADSIKRAEKDSLLLANIVILWSSTDQEEQVKELLGVKKTFWGLFWFLIIISPFLWWIWQTVSEFLRISAQHRYVNRHNASLNERYKEAMEMFHSKPSNHELWIFMKYFLMDLPDTELRSHGIVDLKGKTLFLNKYFFHRDDSTSYNHSRIHYDIVALQEDAVSVIQGEWRVYEDEPRTSRVQSISYSDIKDVAYEGAGLRFGGITISIPEEQVLEFEDSSTTTNVKDFAVAFRKMLIAFKSHGKYNS